MKEMKINMHQCLNLYQHFEWVTNLDLADVIIKEIARYLTGNIIKCKNEICVSDVHQINQDINMIVVMNLNLVINVVVQDNG